jgi:hypothetical protein
MKLLYRYFIQVLLFLGIIFLSIRCEGDSDKVLDQNKVTASIQSPVSGQSFTQNQIIYFSGSANTSPSNKIEEGDLVWTSNRDGVIGIGSGFKRSGLSLGNHTITLTATIQTGKMGTAQIELTNQQSPSGVTILIQSLAGTRLKSFDSIELKSSGRAPDGSAITDPLKFEWQSNIELNPGPILGNGPIISPAGLTPGLHTISLKVTSPNGKTGNASIDLLIEFEKSDITLDILEPFNGFQNVQGQNLICRGSGSITGGGLFEEIVWTSSMDGEIGRSKTCIVPFLSLGTHRITMTASTTDGKKSTVSTIVEVVEK